MITNLISKTIWEDRYRKNDESFEEGLRRVANYIGQNDEEKEMFYDVMEKGYFYPAGRTMSNSGIGKSLTLNNCFTLNLVPDSMEGIFDYVKYGAITQKAGGGTGYNFSLLRPNGTPTSNDAVASGVVSFMNAFDSQTHTVLQGSRRGANMGCLCIYHPDILEFLESKSWDEGKLTHFNLSVLVDDEFMNAVKNNKDVYLRYPCMNEDGKIIYDENKWLTKEKINAKELWDKIMKKAYDTGEYGVLYYDNMNKDNNLHYMETIVTTNPCGEYLSGVLTYNGEVLYDHFGACNLGSIFLHNFVINPFTKKATIDMMELKNTVRIGVRMLDNIIDINNYPLLNYENYQKSIRTIGLGITGLADLLAMIGIKYGSEESVKITDYLMNEIVKTAYDESCDLAVEKGTFKFLDKEEFVQSNFIRKHCKKDKDWVIIKNKILKHGIRNGRLISVAPTGTLSLSFGNNCSSGLEPIFSLEYDRKIKVGGQDESNIQIYKMRDFAYDKFLNTKDKDVEEDVFVTAMDLSVKEHLNILSTVAYHTDMSCSKTINVPSDYPFEDTKDIYMKCWEEGIKGCTIFRPNEIRKGILATENENKINEVKEELKRGEWSPIPDDTIYYKRKVYTGCGKLNLFIGYSTSEDRLVEVYTKRSGNGGCEHNIDSTVICMSGMLRLGGTLDNVKRAFDGCGACNSFTRAKCNGKKLSPGKSCATAILNMIETTLKEIKGKRVEINLNKEIKKEEPKQNIFSDEEIKFLKEYGDISFAQKYNKCPQCGEKLEHVGGCITCNNCSFSKCE